MKRLISNVKNFIGYIIRYFTHYTPIQIAKKESSLKSDIWYKVEYYVRFNSKFNDVDIDEIKINKVKKEEK